MLQPSTKFHENRAGRCSADKWTNCALAETMSIKVCPCCCNENQTGTQTKIQLRHLDTTDAFCNSHGTKCTDKKREQSSALKLFTFSTRADSPMMSGVGRTRSPQSPPHKSVFVKQKGHPHKQTKHCQLLRMNGTKRNYKLSKFGFQGVDGA